MTARIREFLRKRADDGPCLVVDLDVVRENYLAFAKALPDTKVFYAVKANPAPEVLALLAGLGSSFDTASVAEIEMVLAAGAKPDRISFGNTIKKERDVARAYALGVRRLLEGDFAQAAALLAETAKQDPERAGPVAAYAACRAGQGAKAREIKGADLLPPALRCWK